MNCPACGTANPEQARFCMSCASPLARVCPSCGAAAPPEAAFCMSCGIALAPPVAGTPANASKPMAAPLPTSFASGRYAVQSFLGEGGRKRVYLAHDTKLDRDIAFAAIKTEGLDDDGVTRIRREAQAMGKFGDHAHIVTVFDTGEETTSNGVVEPYIVSQYMAGGELTGLIDASERRRVPIVDVVRIASQVAQLLTKALGGEILVSSLVRQLVESSVAASTFAESRDVELKGLAGSHTVHAISWA